MRLMVLAGALRHLDERAATVTLDLQASGILTRRKLPGSRIAAYLPMAWTALRSTLHVGGALRPRRALALLEEAGRRVSLRPPVEQATDEGLLREMELLGAPECLPLRRGMQMLPVAFLFFAAAARLFRSHPKARRLLSAGIPDNPTTRISLDVDALVDAARPLAETFAAPLPTPLLLERLRATPEGREWCAALTGVLARCGQRCANEFDIATPRWIEDPTFLVDLVRAGVAAPPGLRATERLERMAQERSQAVEEAAAGAPWWRRPLLRAAARRVAAYMPLREAPKHHTMFVFLRMRQAALEAGRRMVARGHLDAAEDVMFLERAELAAAFGRAAPDDLRERVARRRIRHERHRAEKPPHFVRSDGVPVPEPEPEPGADGGWRGVGVSGGRVEGPVRVLRTPDPRAMSDGDVIVMEFADPGWTPLFPRAAAVVMEVGGAMCHAAVVARELGIPAVFGVAGATQGLRDGERVVVDGETGVVRAAG
jgi:rifampicin phosphotransferase